MVLLSMSPGSEGELQPDAEQGILGKAQEKPSALQELHIMLSFSAAINSSS